MLIQVVSAMCFGKFQMVAKIIRTPDIVVVFYPPNK